MQMLPVWKSESVIVEILLGGGRGTVDEADSASEIGTGRVEEVGERECYDEAERGVSFCFCVRSLEPTLTLSQCPQPHRHGLSCLGDESMGFQR